jgi:hypothetical protein
MSSHVRPAGLLRSWHPRAQNQAIIAVAAELEPEWPMFVRRVLYVVAERGILPDKGRNSYDKVSIALNKARRAGILPWTAIVNTTSSLDAGHYDSPDDFYNNVLGWARGYRIGRQSGQPSHLITWSEHRGLGAILAGIADEYGVPLIPSGGYDSVTSRYAQAEAALGREVPTVILHMGDHDQHGRQIYATLAEDIPRLYRDLGGPTSRTLLVERLALTTEQAASVYPDITRGDDVQLDALPTPALQAILREAIEARQDPGVRATLLEREDAEREQVIAAAGALS